MAFELILPQSVHEEMVAHALAEQPNECCGLLAGVVTDGLGRVERLYRLVNALASPVEYESDPRSMFEAMRDMTRRGIDVLAVYHSHPTSPPVPSAKDRQRNYSEDVVNFIVSLTVSPPEVRGWWLTAKYHREARWRLE
jgi:proteasome lid subunit RPN8/RPN11